VKLLIPKSDKSPITSLYGVETDIVTVGMVIEHELPLVLPAGAVTLVEPEVIVTCPQTHGDVVPLQEADVIPVTIGLEPGHVLP